MGSVFWWVFGAYLLGMVGGGIVIWPIAYRRGFGAGWRFTHEMARMDERP